MIVVIYVRVNGVKPYRVGDWANKSSTVVPPNPSYPPGKT